jgi:hypothetical protein
VPRVDAGVRFSLCDEENVARAIAGDKIVFNVSVANMTEQDLVFVEGARTNVVAFYVLGFQIPTIDAALFTGLLLHWSLYAGCGDMIEQSPVASGDSVMTGVSGYSRQGLLWQVTGRAASSWLLRGYALGFTGQSKASVSVIAGPVVPAGGLVVEAGPGIG